MLIRSVRAENFMRFSKLRLQRLPASGIVAVEGPNESGKSTIGDAILFAFSGRVRPGRRGGADDLIRWDANHLRVEVEFALPVEDGVEAGRDELLICREIDRFGTNYVRLLSLPDRAELAAGNIQVAGLLRRRLGMDADELRKGFFLDPTDMSLGDKALLGFVERVTGIRAMRDAIGSVETEMERLEREFGHYQKDIGRHLDQIERLSRGVTRLGELEDKLSEVVAAQDRDTAAVGELQRRQEALRSLASRLETLGRKLARLSSSKETELPTLAREIEGEVSGLDSSGEADDDLGERLGSDLGSVIELFSDFDGLISDLEAERDRLSGALDGASSEGTGSLRARFEEALARSSELARRRSGLGKLGGGAAAIAVASASLAIGVLSAPDVRSTVRDMVGSSLTTAIASAVTAVVVAGIAAALLLRRRTLTGRLEEARSEAERLGAEIDVAERDRAALVALLETRERSRMSDFLSAAAKATTGEAAQRVEAFRDRHGEMLGGRGEKRDGGGSSYRKLLSALARAMKKRREELLSRSQELGREAQEVEASARKTRSERDRTENEIRECRAQQAKSTALQEKNAELDAAAGEIRARIEDRRLARQLLEETMATVRARLGPTLAALVREVLPRVTGGRYREVKAGPDLDIQVFSRDKGDFLSWRELSGGTCEALLVALRLAFAQAILASRTSREQFVFLDEPFRRMDVDRTLSTLEVLHDLSPQLRQFFVAQPHFTPEQRERFALHIPTSSAHGELEVEG